MVSVLVIVDDQKLVADGMEHNQSDHHQDSKQEKKGERRRR